MKKIFIITLSFLCLCGCSKDERINQENNDLKPATTGSTAIEEPKTYVDDNNIIVGLYDRSGNTLSLKKEYNGPITVKKDITTFQVFFSQEENVTYQNQKYGEFYYNTFKELNPENKYKVGFNLSYELNDGTKISQNIFNPSTTQTNYDYIEVYLYDSFKHRNDSFYSHIEENEYNDETCITSIKLTAGSKFDDIKSKVILTVFTYDEDDFDESTNEYRGNSKYSVEILNSNKNYE